MTVPVAIQPANHRGGDHRSHTPNRHKERAACAPDDGNVIPRKALLPCFFHLPANDAVMPKKPKTTPETKCSFCHNSKCCTYITQQIDTPRTKRDFDVLLW